MAGKVVTYKVEGFRELEKALKELPKATGKNVVRRTLGKAASPFIDDAKARAPRGTRPAVGRKGQPRPRLWQSIIFSTRLSRRQARLARQLKRSQIEVHAGAKALPHAHLVEYGTHKMAPRPFMRPAWDANKFRALDIIRGDMGKEIMKAAKRLEAKARRAAAKIKRRGRR